VFDFAPGSHGILPTAKSDGYASGRCRCSRSATSRWQQTVTSSGRGTEEVSVSPWHEGSRSVGSSRRRGPLSSALGRDGYMKDAKAIFTPRSRAGSGAIASSS